MAVRAGSCGPICSITLFRHCPLAVREGANMTVFVVDLAESCICAVKIGAMPRGVHRKIPRHSLRREGGPRSPYFTFWNLFRRL